MSSHQKWSPTLLPIFLDVNVWLALCLPIHEHSDRAQDWYASLQGAPLHFNRTTQLALLRLLTTKSVMGDYLLTNTQAIQVLRRWLDSGSAITMEEPSETWERFLQLGSSHSSSPKLWMDAYLTAFTMEAGLTLVTFDQALAKRTPRSILL